MLCQECCDCQWLPGLELCDERSLRCTVTCRVAPQTVCQARADSLSVIEDAYDNLNALLDVRALHTHPTRLVVAPGRQSTASTALDERWSPEAAAQTVLLSLPLDTPLRALVASQLHDTTGCTFARTHHQAHSSRQPLHWTITRSRAQSCEPSER